MKRRLLTGILPFMLAGVVACSEKKTETTEGTDTDAANTTEAEAPARVEVDHANPEKVVQAIFDAAGTGNFEMLRNLCDPNGENDADTKRLCSVDQSSASQFTDYFKKGKINGAAVITGSEASVSILFGLDGTAEETIKLVQRDGKWYLSSF